MTGLALREPEISEPCRLVVAVLPLNKGEATSEKNFVSTVLSATTCSKIDGEA